MPTPTQPWLRAELIAAPETTPGAQLMIPADGIEFHDDQLVFHHQGDVVYVAPQGQLRSITWFARQPHPETARRKAQWPNHGTRWTDEERTELLRHLRAGHSWKAISHAHGRSRTGCQQEAVKQGWLDGETLAPTARLLGGEAADVAEADVGAQTEAKAGGVLAGAPSDPTPSLALATAAADSPTSAEPATTLADPPPSPVFAAASADPAPNADRATAPVAPPPSAGPDADSAVSQTAKALSEPVFATASADSTRKTDRASAPVGPPPSPVFATVSADSPRTAEPATAPADPPPSPVFATASTDPAPSTELATASTAGSSPDPAPAAPKIAFSDADAPRSRARADASATSPTSAAVATTATSPQPNPAAVPPNFALAGAADAVAYPDLAQAAMAIAREATADTDTELQPDRPQIPHQRTDSADTSDPEKDSPPGPGSRFLSRAQSSLVRATLGAYMNPPRAT